jgi:hypothetical protein
MAREILAYHVRGIEEPRARLEAAQELMRTIVAIEEPTPYARMLREHLERMLRYSDALLFHDDLAEIATPFYLHEFVEHANHHGLAFLAEADLAESQMREVPENAGRLMAGLPDDVVVREQYLDFFKNRMFRQTLLCHAQAPIRRELDDAQVEGCFVSSQARATPAEEAPAAGAEPAAGPAAEPAAEPAAGTSAGPPAEPHPPGAAPEPPSDTFTTPEGYTLTTSEPLVRAAMQALGDAWPAPVDFHTLLATAREAAGRDAPADAVGARLRTVLLQAHLARIVGLLGCAPPLAARPGERPVASALARAQCAAGRPAVSSLLHANVRLEDDGEARLLALLDGTRERGALLEALAATRADEPPPTPAELEETLARLASVGLLLA